MNKIISVTILAVSAILLISFLLSWPIYMLWNGCLVPAINGVNEVTWLQAWGISVLCGFLFKSTYTTKT
jgi:hypothetical protein